MVFNTALTGYQEVLYDPSYWGQIVVMTAAHIGNTGANAADAESAAPAVRGFAARSFTEPSNWRSEESLQGLLDRHRVPFIDELDTRALTRHLRSQGSMRGGIFTADISHNDALLQVLDQPKMEGMNAVEAVSSREAYEWHEGVHVKWRHADRGEFATVLRVAVYDYGIKQNILRRLVDTGCEVKVFPHDADPRELAAFEPHGLLLSNGPGDPAAVAGAVNRIRHFLGRLPIFGICMGHQLLALACGGATYKMKFGHRGVNHPVGAGPAGRVLVTVHNHGFAVADDPLPDGGSVTLRSLNDGTIEGLDYPDRNAFSVQFHPEASPGPHDAAGLFEEFRGRMEASRGRRSSQFYT